MLTALTGKPCDATHPYPAPPVTAWADSMEFGAFERQPTSHPDNPTMDTDTAPTWRLLGAWIWDTPCVQDHAREVAESPILTTHLMAAAMLSRKAAGPMEALAFSQVGANSAIEALIDGGGLEPAHDEVSKMHVEERRQLVGECAALVLKGHTSLQLDLEAFYGR